MAMFGGARGLWQAFIRSGVKRGWTSSHTLKQGLAAGLKGIRRTDYLKDYREWAQVPAKADRIKAVRHAYRPSRNLFIETTGKQLRAFRYQIGIDVYKPEEKKAFHMVTNITSTRQLTINEILEQGMETPKQSISGSNFEIIGYHVEAVFHKEGEYWD